MVNIAIIQGRLTKDPELRTTQSGVSVVSFTLANESDFDRDHTNFISCVAWRQTAEFVSKYFSKGMLVIVQGELKSRDWQDRDGNSRTSWEIQCSRANFSESKKSTESHQASEYASKGQYEPEQKPQTTQQQYTELDEDEGELPF